MTLILERFGGYYQCALNHDLGMWSLVAPPTGRTLWGGGVIYLLKVFSNSPECGSQMPLLWYVSYGGYIWERTL